jgi:hypothetical protein
VRPLCAFWLTLNLYRGRSVGLVFLAMFFSPFIATIVQWSGQQVAAMAVLSLSSVALCRAHRPLSQLLIGFTGQVAAFLSYAGAAPLILLQLAYKSGATWTDQALRLVSFPAALATAALVMYGMNYLVFGTFSFPISEWRDPNPARDLSTCLVNLRRFSQEQGMLLTSPPGFVWLTAAALVLGALDRAALRRRSVLLKASAVVLMCEAAITIATGVAVPSRARAWLWVAPLVMCAGGLDSSHRARRWLSVAVVTAFVFAGAHYWVSFYSTAQRALEQQQRLVLRARALQRDKQEHIAFSGDWLPVDRLEYDTFTVLPQARWFVDYAAAAHGVHVRPCRGDECGAIAAGPPGEVVFRLDVGLVVFRFRER